MRRLLTACFVIFVAVAPALAQDKPVDVNIGFGATLRKNSIDVSKRIFERLWRKPQLHDG